MNTNLYFGLILHKTMAILVKNLLILQDVGQAVLESYSRILESLAFTVLSRIEDVLAADLATQDSSLTGKKGSMRSSSKGTNLPSPREEVDKSSAETPCAKTLSDFMGWGVDQGDLEKKDSFTLSDDLCKEKLSNLNTNKKTSYLENLGTVRSPTSCH